MGIKDLKKLIKSKAPKGIILGDPYIIFKNKKVGIDLSGYLYKFVHNSDNKTKNFYIKGLTEMIFDFLKHEITPIFVFDGKPNEAKNGTLEARKKAHTDKIDKIDKSIEIIAEYLDYSVDKINTLSINEISKLIEDFFTKNPDLDMDVLTNINFHISKIMQLNKSIIKITNEIILNVEKLFKLWHIPYVKANSEADFMCAKLSIDNIIDAVCSEDMDMLPHGVKNLITGISSLDFKKTRETTIFNLDNILEELDINMDQFIDTCILAGCDYCGSIKDIGPMKGYKLIKDNIKIENIPGYDKIIGLDEARNEFTNYKKEKYDILKLEFNFSDINIDKLIEFLTTETTYKKKTIINKIDILKTIY